MHAYALTPAPRRHGPVSHRHAGGLRRDLFRLIETKGPATAALMRLLTSAAAPKLAAREQRRIVQLAVRKARPLLLAQTSHGSGPNTATAGFLLRPTHLIGCDHIDDGLEILQLSLAPDAHRMAWIRTVGFVTQHALERLFQRLPTTRTERVLAELESALPWIARLGDAARQCDRNVYCMPVPGSAGGFRAEYVHNGTLVLRTWLPRNESPRDDYALAAIHAWHATPANDPVSTFRRLLADPRNTWMRRPLQPALHA